MKNSVFWDAALCGSYKKNRCFGGKYRLHFQGGKKSACEKKGWQLHKSRYRFLCDSYQLRAQSGRPCKLSHWAMRLRNEVKRCYKIRTCNCLRMRVYCVPFALEHEDSMAENSVASVREPTIPTKRLPLVGEVSSNFCGQMVPRGQRDGSLRQSSRFSRQEPLLFYQVAPQLYSRG
jgi:hypothetical protein